MQGQCHLNCVVVSNQHGAISIVTQGSGVWIGREGDERDSEQGNGVCAHQTAFVKFTHLGGHHHHHNPGAHHNHSMAFTTSMPPLPTHPGGSALCSGPRLALLMVVSKACMLALDDAIDGL
eukprot:3658610-Rhodomonas_salina.2